MKDLLTAALNNEPFTNAKLVESFNHGSNTEINDVEAPAVQTIHLENLCVFPEFQHLLPSICQTISPLDRHMFVGRQLGPLFLFSHQLKNFNSKLNNSLPG
jgi:hypothetical protein